MTSLPWFALRVKPRAEKAVAEVLRHKGYEPFLPLHHERRRWSDRVQTVEVPLFPGYVFCRFDVQRRLPVLTTPGVLMVVGTAKVPQPIDDGEMTALRVLATSGLTLRPWPYLHVGQRIQIVNGPLSGAEGILVEFKAKHRLIASVSLLQRAVSVELPESCAWPLESVPRPSPARAVLRPAHAC